MRVGKRLGDLHAQAKEMIASGVDREEIFSALTEFRAELQASGNEEAQDLLLALMDFFGGSSLLEARL